MICSIALRCKPSEMKERAFQLNLKDKCNKKQKRLNGGRVYYYQLKDECKSLYKQTVHNNDCDYDLY